MKVINLFGGPCTGKSTVASGLFWRMKMQGRNVALVQEYAQEAIWEQRQNLLDDQIYIFAKQQRRLNRLQGHGLDWVITDSPLPLSVVYLKPHVLSDNFHKLVQEVWEKYDNRNFLLTRKWEYNPVGRNQKLSEEADEFHDKVTGLLSQWEVCYQQLDSEQAIEKILELVNIT
jgi:nicotinamide riboside kinase